MSYFHILNNMSCKMCTVLFTYNENRLKNRQVLRQACKSMLCYQIAMVVWQFCLYLETLCTSVAMPFVPLLVLVLHVAKSQRLPIGENFLWLPNRAIICSCGFYLLSFFLTILSSHILDVYHISTCSYVGSVTARHSSSGRVAITLGISPHSSWKK